jgi:hypothetical protein
MRASASKVAGRKVGSSGTAGEAAERPVRTLADLGAVSDDTAAKLAKLGIHTWFDLVLHLPMRYEDETRVVPLRTRRCRWHDVQVEGCRRRARCVSGRVAARGAARSHRAAPRALPQLLSEPIEAADAEGRRCG